MFHLFTRVNGRTLPVYPDFNYRFTIGYKCRLVNYGQTFVYRSLRELSLYAKDCKPIRPAVDFIRINGNDYYKKKGHPPE